MTWVSSTSRARARQETVSSQSCAASTSARFVMLFDPGTDTIVRGTCVSGTISSFSG